MEPVRPKIDSFVFHMVKRRSSRKSEFVETSDGHVHALLAFTLDLTETIPMARIDGSLISLRAQRDLRLRCSERSKSRLWDSCGMAGPSVDRRKT